MRPEKDQVFSTCKLYSYGQVFISHFSPSLVIKFTEQEQVLCLRTSLTLLHSLLHLDPRSHAETYFNAHWLSFLHSIATSFHKSLANTVTLAHTHSSTRFLGPTVLKKLPKFRNIFTGISRKTIKCSICLRLMQALLTLLSPNIYNLRNSFLTLRKVLARDELQYSDCQGPVMTECWKTFEESQYLLESFNYNLGLATLIQNFLLFISFLLLHVIKIFLRADRKFFHCNKK